MLECRNAAATFEILLAALLKVAVSINHRAVLTLKSNWMSMYLPKRLELSLRNVLALPKAWKEDRVEWDKEQSDDW